MSKNIRLRVPWFYVITAFCLAALVFGPLFVYSSAEASASTAGAATSAVFDGDDDCDGRLFANLTGPTIGGQSPRGFARFCSDDDDRNQDNDRRLKVFVRFVNLPEDTMLRVYVDDHFVGSIRLRENGNSHGHFDPDFDIRGGDVIEVRTGGDVILSGVFHFGHGTHTPTPTPTPTPCLTSVVLSGAQEVPPNNSTAMGIGSVWLSANQTTIIVDVNFTGLSAPAIAAHIHGPATAGTNAGIIFPLSGVPNSTTGIIPTQSFPVTGTQVALLQAGLLYINVHTANFPGGEIRAQLVGGCGPPPTPTSTPTNTPTFTPTPTATPAGPRLFTTTLRGGRVVPPVETNARGFAAVVLNQDVTQVSAFAAFVNLSSGQTSASINCPAVPGENGPIVFNLGTVGGSSGLVAGTFSISEVETAELRAGLCYLVIGSQNHPNGEIRGQLINRYMHRDFDGDGRSDISLFRPSNGTWYYLNSSDSGFAAGQFGTAGDKPIAGDFDGDGRGDLAVFRNVAGLGFWYVKNSSDHSFVSRQWGLGNDIPMSGDFDGDGRSDLAVFRPSDGNWYIRRSSNGALSAVHWGQSGDIPISSDYDGDGIDDLAVFRPSTGMWYVNRSSDGTYSSVNWGLQGDIPVTGDFDNDGLADIAVFRPSDGNWYINGSRGALLSVHFGASGDIPVPGRFDGDDKTDIAVFRPSEGNWYILKSQTNAMTATNFGLNGDIPIANY